MEFSLIDTLWVFLAAILVFFMNLGFASVEAGFARSKNTVNILSKNFIVFAVSSLGFLLLGWGLMFGGDNPFIGTEHLFILGSQDLSFYDNTLTSSVPFWGKFFFQLVFCGTAATIVSGSVAERVKYITFILFSFVLTLVIYPIVGHWVWGGGWLADLGFRDFAGDAVVHSLGGWSALAGAMLLGSRIGKYGKDGKPRAIPGHSMSLAVIGLFVLWLGWFGFNPGSTMSFQNPSDVMHILMTTNTAAIAAVVTSTATSWILLKKPDLGMTVNGCLAGLVGITGSCAYVSVESSLLIGALSGILVVFAVQFFDRVHIDDPVGATAVHLCCGVFGTICVGLFSQAGVTSLSTVDGLFFGGGFGPLGIQLLGVVVIGAFSFLASGLVWLVLKKTIGIRVSPEEEIQGLDIGEHGNVAYPDFALAAETVEGGFSPAPISAAPASPAVPVEKAVPVEHLETPGAKITKVTILTQSQQVLRPAGGPGRPGHHRHHGDQRLRLRRAARAHGLLPRQPGGIPPAAQGQDRHRRLQGPGRNAARDRAEDALHRQHRRRQGLPLRRGGRAQDPHRRARLRRAAGRAGRKRLTFSP